MLESFVARFNDFRSKLHASFPKRRDALLELTDALSGNTSANSPVALSLSPLFSRQYSSVHDAVDNFHHTDCSTNTNEAVKHIPGLSTQDIQKEQNISEPSQPVELSQSFVQQECQAKSSDEKEDNEERVKQRTKRQIQRLKSLKDFLPNQTSHLFYLLVTDATSLPRPYAKTLEDRQIVYIPNPAPGNKPIVVGHKYSTIAILPEKNGTSAPPWAIPLSIEQIPSHQTDNLVASRQIRTLLTNTDLPFLNNLTVNVADSLYCSVPFLGSIGDIDNLITVVRCPSNRVFYFSPNLTVEKVKGHPVWFGERFDMHNPDTWGNPHRTIENTVIMASGKIAIIKLEAWDNMLMRGKRKIPMHKDPFTLVRCCLFDSDGNLVFKRPLWLIVFGKRRMELSPVDAWLCYRQRYDIEHFFRFGKNRLLMGRYQTSIIEHEENWVEIVGLAYFQLWMASPLATSLPYPWERYSIPKENPNSPGPSMTQRNFERIIQQVGKHLPPLQPRGKSPGRLPGHSPGQRQKQEVVFKGGKQTKKKTA